MEVQLVFIDLIPHVTGNGASPTRLILIRRSINNNDSTVLALAGRGVETRHDKALLRNQDLLKRNAIAQKA